MRKRSRPPASLDAWSAHNTAKRSNPLLASLFLPVATGQEKFKVFMGAINSDYPQGSALDLGRYAAWEQFRAPSYASAAKAGPKNQAVDRRPEGLRHPVWEFFSSLQRRFLFAGAIAVLRTAGRSPYTCWASWMSSRRDSGEPGLRSLRLGEGLRRPISRVFPQPPKRARRRLCPPWRAGGSTRRRWPRIGAESDRGGRPGPGRATARRPSGG